MLEVYKRCLAAKRAESYIDGNYKTLTGHILSFLIMSWYRLPPEHVAMVQKYVGRSWAGFVAFAVVGGGVGCSSLMQLRATKLIITVYRISSACKW
jgi:hypothetical protein